MRHFWCILAVMTALAACGDDAGTGATTGPTSEPTAAPTTLPTTEAPTTTVAPVTTVATTTTIATTTTADFFYAVIDTGAPDVFGAFGDPHGSGCVIPPGDVIPDGVWFGYPADYVGGFITLDVACYFTGDAATAARIQDGLPGEIDSFEYVRNMNPRTYAVRLVSGAEVYSIPEGSGFPVLIATSAWPNSAGYYDCPGPCPVWLYINDGVATALVEMYFE